MTLRSFIRHLAIAAIACVPWLSAPLHAQEPSRPAPASDSNTFTNPVLDAGADPWVYAYKGFYYYMNSPGRQIVIWKTKDITDLRHAEKKVVWKPEPGKAWSQGIWAPEMIRWGGKWYVYFAADAGANETHRMFVIENPSDDPLQGEWTFKGQVKDSTDRWAIDGDVFELRGQHYMLWAGWKGSNDGEQDLFIAHMSNPWTIDSERSLISAPTHDWETHGDLPHRHVSVNEGPEALIHGEDLFVVFSASGCWTDEYKLGALRASTDSNPLDPKSWTKIDHPLFVGDPAHGVYAPGHNAFFKSPDGKTDWIIYHANPQPHQGCDGKRSPRIQPFTWNTDGTPNFGKPVPPGVPLDKPGS